LTGRHIAPDATAPGVNFFSAKRPSVVVSRIQKTFLALRTPDRAKGCHPLDTMEKVFCLTCHCCVKQGYCGTIARS